MLALERDDRVALVERDRFAFGHASGRRRAVFDVAHVIPHVAALMDGGVTASYFYGELAAT